MADPSDDPCFRRQAAKAPVPNRTKEASAMVYLVEELGDARLRCDQLMRYLDEAVKLIEKSSHKDHFFEVAGHLIQGIPEVVFKLHKSLQAVALATDRMDYEEIKQELSPEKVDELEQVLKEIRVHPVRHRSQPSGTPSMNPQQAAKRLREIAKVARVEGSLPASEMASLIRALDPSRKAHMASPDVLDKLAEQLENPTGVQVSRTQLATLLSRIAMESEFNNALNSVKTADELGDFSKGSNVALNFESIKDLAIGAARAANSSRWRPALVNLQLIVDEIGTILVNLGSMDTAKSEALKREIRQVLPQAARVLDEAAPTSVMATLKKAEDDDRRSRYEEGKPADPTKKMSPEDAKEWKANIEEYGDSFKEAASKRIDQDNSDEMSGPIQRALKSAYMAGVQSEGMSKDEAKTEVVGAIKELRDILKYAEHLRGHALPELQDIAIQVWQIAYYWGVHAGSKTASVDRWKVAAEAIEGYKFEVEPYKMNLTDEYKYQITMFYPRKPRKVYHKLFNTMSDARDFVNDLKKALKRGEPLLPSSWESNPKKKWENSKKKSLEDYGKKQSSEDEDKLSRFEEGKPADPTKQMSPEDAKEWKSNTEEYGDKFKEASVDRWKASAHV